MSLLIFFVIHIGKWNRMHKFLTKVESLHIYVLTFFKDGVSMTTTNLDMVTFMSNLGERLK
jgi:hypothetical protein